MIFITVGTTSFPFIRMTRIFEVVCEERHNDELVIFQHGVSPMGTTAKNVVVVSYLDFVTMNRYLRQARVIICHGGPATIYQALSYGKAPWVLPREKRYGDHVNDHQVCFCSYMVKKHLISILSTNRNMPSLADTKTIRAFFCPDKRLLQYLHDAV